MRGQRVWAWGRVEHLRGPEEAVAVPYTGCAVELVMRWAMKWSAGDVAGRRAFEAARAELDAALTLLLELRGGARPACVHLRRAAAQLEGAAAVVDNDPAPGPTLGAEAPPARLLSRLEPGRRGLLERHWGTVAEEAQLDAAAGNGGRGSAVDESARVVHDVLRHARRRLLRDAAGRSRRRTALRRLILIAFSAAVLALALALVLPAILDRLARGRVEELATRPAVGPPVEVGAEALAAPVAEGSPWDSPGAVRIPARSGALVVRLDRRSHAGSLEISLDNNDRYLVELLSGGAVVWTADAGPRSYPGGLVIHRFEIPEAASAGGFDAVRVSVAGGDGSYAVGHLLLLGSPGEPSPEGDGQTTDGGS